MAPTQAAYVLIALLVAVTGVQNGDAIVSPPRLVIVPSDTATSGGVNSTAPLAANITTFPALAGKGRNGYLSVFTHAAPSFHVGAPNAQCTGLETVGKQAAAQGCTYATNGGPFKSLISGGCTGAVIMDGDVAVSDFATGEAMFGLTQDGRWVVGHVANHSEADTLGVTQLVTGFGWLVYDGHNVGPAPGGEQAPRTAVGVDKDGRLLLLEVDGCEKCSSGKGPTLHELATFMASPAVGAQHAINLDGGGSSTFVSHGKLVDFPTCIDIDFKCERSVATIMCLK